MHKSIPPILGPVLPLCLALLTPAVAPTAARGAITGQGWSVLTTEHFTAYSSADADTTKRVGDNLEALRSALSAQLADVSFDDPVSTSIYLYPDAEAFSLFALQGGSSFFVPHIHANFAALVAADAGRATPVVYRQYVNHLVHRELPQAPAWLRLGLAELLSTFQVIDDRAYLGSPVNRDPTLLEGTVIGLEELLAADQLPSSPDRAEAFLDHSWRLVHYLLIEDETRRSRTRTWARGMRTDESAGSRFLEAFATTAPELEAALREYSLREELPLRTVPVTDAPSEHTLAPLSEHDALLVQADLLLHSQPTRSLEVEDLFARATELQPGSPIVTAGRGLLAEQSGDRAAARDLYETALAALPGSDWARHRDGFRLHFYYGDAELELLGGQPPSSPDAELRLEKAIDAFQACTELRPAYGEAWARLGFAHSLSPTSTADAVPALETAYGLLPEREDVAMNLLLAYARVGERPRATVLVENLEHRGETTETVARAREVLFQIDYNAAAQLVRDRDLDGAAAILEGIVEGSSNPSMVDAAKTLLGRIGR